MRPLTILTYHSIDDSGSVISVAPHVFCQQMDFLAQYNVPVLSLEQAAQHISECSPLPQGAVVITFDDGFENNYTDAFPHLRRHGFPATVFMVAGGAGKHNDWPGQPTTIPRLPLLSWEQMEIMGQHNIGFAAHTMTHPPLTEISPEQIREEIGTSKHILKQKLGGAEIPFFAYPYGVYNPAILEIVRSEFSGACSAKLGRVLPGADPVLLERVDMYYLRDIRLFRLLIHELRLNAYLAVRGLLREVRGRALPHTKPYSVISPATATATEDQVSV